MNAKNIAQRSQSRFDAVKWFFVFVLLAAGVVANEYFSATAWAIRAAVGIVWAVGLILLAGQTAKGLKAWTFMKGARTELRKVVWPTRQETVQTTLMVVLVVFVMAIILWGLDSVFLWGVSWLTGQRG